ncbi:MAG: U32 family peptidase [Ruminococcaceae bacterium]|nr:U32 family peptidase [Oscillospiraceae bacterium]
MKSNIEILAPGGSLECLKTAIDSGADAVYFGGSKFGARSNAVNLSNEQITEAVEYAHLRFAKVYVVVNTLLSDKELSEAFEFIKFCYIEGVDGVIVQDIGVFRMIKSSFPDFRVHASTQLTIHNLDGALWAQKMGIDRVVLSRELSFDEIKHIASNTTIELEVFVHGALCMSYSGQCLMSSFLGGRSGNRGGCAQPCRLAYTLADSNGKNVSEKGKYLLSLKDLCLIDHIADLKKIGITSLKIEGRMKSESYVSAVCGIYNKYRDGGKVSDEDRTLLANIFSRGGFTKGYYNREYGRDMLCYNSNQDHIFDSATETVKTKAKEYSESEYKIAVDAEFEMKLNQKPVFKITYDGKSFCCEGENNAESASSAPVTKERIEQQLLKLGGTVFAYSSLKLDVEGNLYISVKDINTLRRNCFLLVQKHILGEKRSFSGKMPDIIKPAFKEQSPLYTASVLTEAQAKRAYELGFEKIYVPYSEYVHNKELYDSDADVFAVKLPPIMHDSLRVDYDAIQTDEVMITNIGQLSHSWSGKRISADYRLNVFNSLSIKQLMTMGVSQCTVSAELSLAQIKELGKSIPIEAVVYGRIAMMTMRNCVVRSAKDKCGCKTGEVYYLKDRKNYDFPLITDKASCTNVIYNSTPIVMSDRMDEIKPCGVSYYRFDFTTETPDEMNKIFELYEKGKKAGFFFTRGHYYKNVL